MSGAVRLGGAAKVGVICFNRGENPWFREIFHRGRSGMIFEIKVAREIYCTVSGMMNGDNGERRMDKHHTLTTGGSMVG
jgi:hypothetical protein